MHTFIRRAATVLAGVVLTGGGLSAGLSATGAHAASAKAVPAVCAHTTAAGWICFLRYCDRYYQNAGQCSGLQAGGEGPHGKAPGGLSVP